MRQRIKDWFNRRPVVNVEYKIRKVDFSKITYDNRESFFTLLQGAYYVYMEGIHKLKGKDERHDQMMKATGILELYTELKATHDNEVMMIERAQKEKMERDLKTKKKSIL